MSELSKEQVYQNYEQAILEGQVCRYKKFGLVNVRPANPGEKITTCIKGEIETTNVANSGDVVVMNMLTDSREQYILAGPVFKKRYTFQQSEAPIGNWNAYVPTGETDAFVWNAEPSTFVAPWGEPMVINPGDFLCRVPGTVDDIYRIAKTEMEETYRKVGE